jgi:hypothetical protein
MATDAKKPEQKSTDRPAPDGSGPDDEESVEEELEQELAEPHLPLDGTPPEHWKHVAPPATEEQRQDIETAKEEHQERRAHGRPLGKY